MPDSPGAGRGTAHYGTIMLDLAIIGGGPGGLMSAWYLKKKLGELCRVTIFEASDRLGGKGLTRNFESAAGADGGGAPRISVCRPFRWIPSRSSWTAN